MHDVGKCRHLAGMKRTMALMVSILSEWVLSVGVSGRLWVSVRGRDSGKLEWLLGFVIIDIEKESRISYFFGCIKYWLVPYTVPIYTSIFIRTHIQYIYWLRSDWLIQGRYQEDGRVFTDTTIITRASAYHCTHHHHRSPSRRLVLRWT